MLSVCYMHGVCFPERRMHEYISIIIQWLNAFQCCLHFPRNKLLYVGSQLVMHTRFFVNGHFTVQLQ